MTEVLGQKLKLNHLPYTGGSFIKHRLNSALVRINPGLYGCRPWGSFLVRLVLEQLPKNQWPGDYLSRDSFIALTVRIPFQI